ncbi:MAG: extracellular solute-binding protein [Clostridiales bacterium]|nr:extracellular solute-binding protein [Clostridiales bacterium]
MLARSKILAAAIAAAMLFSSSACGSAAPAVTEAPETASMMPETAAEPSEVASEAAPEPAYDGPVGLSKYSEIVRPTFARMASLDPKFKEGQSYENNIWVTEYRDVLGIELDTIWSAEGPDAYNEKLQLSIVSGDVPDIFVCNSAQFTSLVNAGMLEPLESVVEEWAIPLVAENLQADGGEGIRQATIDGNLYGLPQASVGAGAFQFLFMREDWRVKLGLEVPKTMDDLYAVAKAFVEQDPDGNGIDDTWGLGISNKPFETFFTYRGFFNGFGAYMKQWINNNGVLEDGIIQPEMKLALAELNKYYEEGLIDPEFVTKDSMAVSADAISGKVGLHFGEWWVQTWPLPDGVKLGQDWKAYTIPFAASNSEKKLGGVAKLLGRYVVKKGYEHPEALVKMYNLFQERVMSQNYDTTIYKGDGTYDFQGLAPIAPVIGVDRNVYDWGFVTKAVDAKDQSLLAPGNADQIDKFTKVMAYLDGNTPFVEGLTDEQLNDNTDYYNNYRVHYGPEAIMGLLDYYNRSGIFKLDAFYGPDTPAMLDNAAQLQSNAEEMIINIVTGAEDLDYFDEFVSEWKLNGGEQMIKEVNEWYNAQ